MTPGDLTGAIPLVRNLSSPLVLVIGLVLAVLSYVRTHNFRQRTGRNPWGIPPWAWGVATLFISILGTILSIIACATTKTVPPGPFGSGPSGYPQWPPQQSRTTAGGGGPPQAYGGPVSPAPGGTPAAPPSSWPTPAAGWMADPTGRHQFRYHDGTSYTAHVADSGVASVDPM